MINRCGVITLNRPKALNAINLPMVCKILDALKEWERCADLVVVRGGEKAFCAGGDVAGITKGGPQAADKGKTFFRTEYLMNNTIGTYKIPYVAIVHGITMGGGVGLSVHGKYRIATESTVFAMPETQIGLFPDVGGTYFLPRLAGKLGLYLALTGDRLKGMDVVKAGVATHFCQSKDIPDLFNALINIEGSPCDLEANVLSKFTVDPRTHVFSLSTHIPTIDRIFSLPSVEQMMEELERDGSEWCLTTLKRLKTMSPISLKVTKKALEFGAVMSLQECLQMENRIAGAAVEARISADFYEGVRALLIDKDKKPKWSPQNLTLVTDEMVEGYFKPLSPKEELIIA
ncbi:hypothetical protein AAG570_003557 [Ranatra chinensis]|uniref:3-hydroxyisobutyryl-CoA hydrolase, mitochondrial n=1 Tax=Ranatra chinensis TaxID=642074 RepID=A0ABD0YIG1_9HEMI